MCIIPLQIADQISRIANKFKHGPRLLMRPSTAKVSEPYTHAHTHTYTHNLPHISLKKSQAQIRSLPSQQQQQQLRLTRKNIHLSPSSKALDPGSASSLLSSAHSEQTLRIKKGGVNKSRTNLTIQQQSSKRTLPLHRLGPQQYRSQHQMTDSCPVGSDILSSAGGSSHRSLEFWDSSGLEMRPVSQLRERHTEESLFPNLLTASHYNTYNNAFYSNRDAGIGGTMPVKSSTAAAAAGGGAAAAAAAPAYIMYLSELLPTDGELPASVVAGEPKGAHHEQQQHQNRQIQSGTATMKTLATTTQHQVLSRASATTDTFAAAPGVARGMQRYRSHDHSGTVTFYEADFVTEKTRVPACNTATGTNNWQESVLGMKSSKGNVSFDGGGMKMFSVGGSTAEPSNRTSYSRKLKTAPTGVADKCRMWKEGTWSKKLPKSLKKDVVGCAAAVAATVAASPAADGDRSGAGAGACGIDRTKATGERVSRILKKVLVSMEERH